MDANRKTELLQQQIDEARDRLPTDFNLWRQQTEVVLRNVIGDANPLYVSFKKVRYTLMAATDRTPRSDWDAARVRGIKQAIAVLKAAQMEVSISGGTPVSDAQNEATGTSIFIVHGRDDAKKHDVARFLRNSTGREPVILHEQTNGGRTVIEKFEQHAAGAAFAVVIATGDDQGRAATDHGERPRARQNVIFELGFFFGSLGRGRVVFLYEEDVERPSDIDGLVRISLDAAGAWKLPLARELDAAGIGIDWAALK